MPQSTYAGYEIGSRKIPLELIEKLAGSLGVSSTYLVTGDDHIPNQINNYTSHEQSLIKKYRALDKHGKKAVDLILEHEFKRKE